jgi:hypothetical protein
MIRPMASVIVLAALALSQTMMGQSSPDTTQAHCAAAKAAAGTEHINLYDRFADSLYFIGTKEHSSWAVRTSDGLIVIDALFDYASKTKSWTGCGHSA